ncbi:MAG: butyrate kinase [Erysipelotrichaceae bacterium]|nr:butyrate kinase [Erysipelotrichaceae bacterium]MDY5251952.1 butyrate kinase [Erysipelotrichaceae bacterium]
MKNYKILVINPGSTSTKLSLFINKEHITTTDVFHDSSILKTFPTINDQLTYRMEVVNKFIKENNIDLCNLDAIASRGGPSFSVVSGTYEVDDLLIEDTKASKGGLYHSSMLGVQMAKMIQEKYGGKIFMSDPTVVDEYCDLARITGIEGIYRRSICHALNLKAVAHKYANEIGKPYEKLNLIVCHIDGGITITAHENGMMIDGNDGGGGDGPFTPTRMGSMAITDVIRYLWDKPKSEMLNLCSCTGGLSNYFNTSNSDKIHSLVGIDPKATRVWQAMIYQVSKSIGAMSCTLKGKVDAIILTGGLMRFDDVYEMIKDRCEWIAPIKVYPGEYEQEALAFNTYQVLTGKQQAKKYTGKPVWNGFKDQNV